jgi:DnaJ-class molecular chaperone
VKNNPYTILEISNTITSQSDIRRAFQRMALKYHPDRNKDSESKRKFIEIVEAYEALCENQARRDYDNGENTYSDEYYSMLLYLVIAVLQYIVVQLSQPAHQL